MRIIISEKGEVTSSPVTVTHTSYTDDSDDNHDSNNNSDDGDSRNTGSSSKTGLGSGKDDEEAAVWRVYSIVCSALSSSASAGGSAEWIEDKSRFKDYITAPKPSGYDPLSLLPSLPPFLSLSVTLSPFFLPLSSTPFFFSYSFSIPLFFRTLYPSLSISFYHSLSYTPFLSNSPSHYLNFPVYMTYSISFDDLSFDLLIRCTPTSFDITTLLVLSFILSNK